MGINLKTEFKLGDHVRITRKSDESAGEVKHYFRPGTTGVVIKLPELWEYSAVVSGHVLTYKVREDKLWGIFPMFRMRQYVPGTCLELIK